MNNQNVPNFFPVNPPIYNIDKSYEENFDSGPFFTGDIPIREMPPKDEWINFLDQKIASRIGIPAGPLLNSNWTTLSAKLGFDIVTYKTIRSRKYPCHHAPNCIYVDTKGQLDKSRFEEKLIQKKSEPESMDEIAITNSFGMPSTEPEIVQEDIDRALNGISDGQVLIASVVGTPEEGKSIERDYAKAAYIAKDAGAKIVEANFSCPNVTSGEGSIFNDPDAVGEIAKEIVREIGDVPLIIKVGYFTDENNLRAVLHSAASAGVRAICGINTIGMEVVNENGEPALGKGRLKSGICGAPIRNTAIEFTTQARRIIDEEKLGLTLLGVGGVTLPEHFDHLLNVGADIAMSATGFMWDPYLAARYHKTHL